MHGRTGTAERGSRQDAAEQSRVVPARSSYTALPAQRDAGNRPDIPQPLQQQAAVGHVPHTRPANANRALRARARERVSRHAHARET